MCWLYLLYVPISLFRISLLGLRHGKPSLCGCRWPRCLLWLFFDRFWLREEWALIRVSKSARALQIQRPASEKPGKRWEILHLRYTFFLITFIERSRELFSFSLNLQRRHSTLKTDVYSAITVLSRANEDAIWGNYIPICLWVETNAPCALSSRTGHRIRSQPCFCSMAKDDTGIALWHRLLWQWFGVRDHNIISRQEGTRWWDMHEAEGHRTGVNIYTNTASQNDWLPRRACCEKSIQHSNPFCPPAFKRRPTSLRAPLPGVFKMYNH